MNFPTSIIKIENTSITLQGFFMLFSCHFLLPKVRTDDYFAVAFLECHINEMIWYAKKKRKGFGGIEGLYLKGLCDSLPEHESDQQGLSVTI